MFRITRLAAAGCGFLLAVGCASMPKPIAYNRDASQVKTIEVLPMRHSELNVFIMNNPGYSFGLIGTAIAEANLAVKRKWLRAATEKAELDHAARFRDALVRELTARGYEVTWRDPYAEPEKSRTKRENYGLRKSYAPSTADAQLDVNLGFVGYIASGSSDKAPYRPAATAMARLVGADGKEALFLEQVVYNNAFGAKDAVTIEPDDRYVYPDFDDLKAAGPTAVEGLAAAIESVATELAEQL